jgi:hypothetical protein
MQTTFSTALLANQAETDLINANWPYKQTPLGNGMVFSLMLWGSDTGGRLRVSVGAQTVVPTTNISGGGTAGTLPTIYNVTPIKWIAGPGQPVQILVSEAEGNTPTIDGVLTAEPL